MQIDQRFQLAEPVRRETVPAEIVQHETGTRKDQICLFRQFQIGVKAGPWGVFAGERAAEAAERRTCPCAVDPPERVVFVTAEAVVIVIVHIEHDRASAEIRFQNPAVGAFVEPDQIGIFRHLRKVIRIEGIRLKRGKETFRILSAHPECAGTMKPFGGKELRCLKNEAFHAAPECAGVGDKENSFIHGMILLCGIPGSDSSAGECGM